MLQIAALLSLMLTYMSAQVNYVDASDTSAHVNYVTSEATHKSDEESYAAGLFLIGANSLCFIVLFALVGSSMRTTWDELSWLHADNPSVAVLLPPADSFHIFLSRDCNRIRTQVARTSHHTSYRLPSLQHTAYKLPSPKHTPHRLPTPHPTPYKLPAPHLTPYRMH